MEPIRIAVLGVGQQGTHHGMAIKRMEGLYELTAVADTVEARRVKSVERFGVPAYGDLDGLLGDAGTDWVIVATPSSLHADHAIRAMRAGKHVVVEKPMAMTKEEARAMADTAAETGRRLVVFQNRRWDHDFLTAKAAYDSGRLGQVFCIKHEGLGYNSALLDFGIKEFRPQWRAEKEWGGGLLYDWGAHRIDQLLDMVKAEPVRVYANLQKRIWSTEVDTHFTVFVEFDDGCAATLETSFACRAGHGGFIVCGTEGAYQNGKLTTGPQGGMVEEGFSIPKEGNPFWTLLHKAVSEGGPMPVPLEGSLKLMRVMDAVFESDATKRVVEL